MTQEEWAKTVQWVGVVGGCIIKKDGKYLLVQEKQPKAYGLWNIPAGYVDKDEEVEVAAIREAKEESGFDVEIEGLLALFHDTTFEPVKHVYRAHIVGGDLKPQPEEILAVSWFSYAEIKEMNEAGKIRAPWIFKAITKVEMAEC